MRKLSCAAVLALTFFVIAARPAAAQTVTPSGTSIQNVATVSFIDTAGVSRRIASNQVTASVAPLPTTSKLAMLRASAPGSGIESTAGPTQCRGTGGTITLPPPLLSDGTVLDASGSLPLAPASSLHGGEAAFVQMVDGDQNLDAAASEYAEVKLTSLAGDVETLRLRETGVNTGVFTGYIQTRAAATSAGNCVLEVERDSEISSTYADPADSTDSSSASALIDPYGLVFDSRTGTPVDGARVRLLDAETGAPAAVMGDDGVSSYPSEIVTGEQATDAGGTVYTLPPGVFRFPLVAPGKYRLQVDPPAGRAFPSQLTIEELARTPGSPYRLNAGSFGAQFAVETAPAIAVDIPLDTVPTQLFLQKSTTATVAAVGDFVQYQLAVENTAANAAAGSVRTVDRLPSGARYRKGSTRINGELADDPQISADGRTLTFVGGPLAPRQRVEIRYVVEVTAGVHGRQLVNEAQAFGPDGRASNLARATIQLREELFRNRAIVMGRVVEGDCATPASHLKGVAGVRIYLEDGRYSITDAHGKYHFEDVTPGSHVVQMDTVTIPDSHRALKCIDRVRQAGRAYSQFIDVRGGALWRSDFVLQRKPLPKGAVTLQLDTALAGSAQMRHTLTLDVAKLPVAKTQVLLMLPEGLQYQQHSAKLDGTAIEDPAVSNNVLSFELEDIQADSRSTLTLRTNVEPRASGALSIKSLAMFATPAQAQQRTDPVENVILRGRLLYETASYRFAPAVDVVDAGIRLEDEAQLESIVAAWRGVSYVKLSAIGHTDDAPVSAADRPAYADKRALSHARADAVAKYLAVRLDIDPANVSVQGGGPDERLAQGHDAKSPAFNRRVDIALEGLRIVATGGLTLKTASARSAAVETTGPLPPGVPAPVSPFLSSSRADPEKHRADTNTIDLERLRPGIGWLLPTAQALPAIPSIKIAIQHLPSQRVELLSNGAAVSPLNFDGASTNRAGTVSVSRWRGIDLKEGDNQLIAVIRDRHGSEVRRLAREIHYAGGAVRAELVREASTLVADGRTHPIIALRMSDAYGRPARPGTLGAFRVAPPYRSSWEVRSLDDNKLLATGAREPIFSVNEDGLARIELEPTSQAGTALIRLRFNERQQQEIRVWLEPRSRDWILVGIAEGTAAYDTISGNMHEAEQVRLAENYAEDGRVAFFAKGAIKGEYLLTAAYDSAREREFEKDRLHATVEPDRFYTLYGDATEQRFEAATTHKLYVKLERQQFAALFGDFETGLTVTELSRYSRSFTGLKSDYAGEHFGYSAFAAKSAQGYVKDELPGDGTSGLYRLSRRPPIINSDKVRIEVRDRFRSEVIVESKLLTRHIDYSIDYLNGTLFFKQPVPSRSASFDPVIIVAEYEVLNGGEEELTAGGRAFARLADERLEVGASYIQEGVQGGDTRVAGADLRWRIGAATELRAELARSRPDDPRVHEAAAYLTQIAHVTEKLDARAYIREQQAGFGVGQQLSTESGTRKVGADGRYRLTEHLSLEGETYRQEVLETGAKRELVSAQVRQEAQDYSLGAGVRDVTDRGLANGQDNESRQAFVNGSVDLFADLITLRASQDFELAGAGASIDFPARSVLGLDYHWRADTTFFAQYEHAGGDRLDADMTRVGVRTIPWERAQLQSSLSQEATEYGPRVFANFGLTQGWQVNERWGLDFGIDQSRTVASANAEPFNANVPLASGNLSDDFLATFIGAMYRSELWTFTSRLESRRSDQEDRVVVSAGWYREPLAGRAFSLATQWFDSSFAAGADAMAGDIQLAWAYRPADSDWIVLNRLDLKRELRRDAMGEFESARVVDNFNSNWQLDPRTQLGVQFGVRYVRSTFDGERYSGLSGLMGIDARHDLSERFDVGLHATQLSSFQSDVSDYSIGFDFGITLARNMRVSVGYNVAGFRDDDFEASRYSAQGPFIRFRVKADQETFGDLKGLVTGDW